MDKNILRARLEEVLEEWDVQSDQVPMIAEDLLTELTKLDMESVFDEETEEEADELEQE